MLWSATVILASIAILVMVWPAPNRYRATAFVRVGPRSGVPTTTLTLDADSVARPQGMTRLIEEVRTEPLLAVQVRSVARSQMAADSRVRDATALVRATANAVAPTRTDSDAIARTNIMTAAAALGDAQARLRAADRALTEFRRVNGNDDPAATAGALDGSIQDALSRGDLARAQQLQTLRAQQTLVVQQFSQLTAQRYAVAAEVMRATNAYDAARDRIDNGGDGSVAEVNVTSISDDTLSASRPILRLGFGAALLIAAIVAADALFITRRKLRSPYYEETARERHARRSAKRQAKRDAKREAVLDLPDLEMTARDERRGSDVGGR